MPIRDFVQSDSRLFMWFVLATWMPLVSYLFPLIRSLELPVANDAEASSTIAAIWIGWFSILLPFALGIAGGALALRGFKRWKWMVALAAVLFLAQYVRDLHFAASLVKPSLLYFESGFTLLDILQTEVRNVHLGLAGAVPFGDAARFAYARLVMPLLQFYILIVVLLQFRSRSSEGIGSRSK